MRAPFPCFLHSIVAQRLPSLRRSWPSPPTQRRSPVRGSELRNRLRGLLGRSPWQFPSHLRCPGIRGRLSLLETVSQVARKAPRRAGQLLATVIEPAVLRPVEKGYQGDVWLRNDPAAPEGGRVCDQRSCGGRI